MGGGVGKRAAGVHWGVVARIAAAWVLTLPAAAALAAVFYLMTRAIGVDIAGPLVVSAFATVGAAALYVQSQRSRDRVTAADV